jgi:hypothetical protein
MSQQLVEASLPAQGVGSLLALRTLQLPALSNGQPHISGFSTLYMRKWFKNWTVAQRKVLKCNSATARANKLH